MPEWSIGAVSKTVDPLGGPRVRIPVSPLCLNRADEICSFALFFIAFLLLLLPEGNWS